MFLCGMDFQSKHKRSGFWYGKGRSNTPSITLNTAVPAPMARASTAIAVMEKLGERRSDLAP